MLSLTFFFTHTLFFSLSLCTNHENHLSPTTKPSAMGTSRPSLSLKSLSYRCGGMLRCCNSINRYERLDSELERKLMVVKQSSSPGSSNIKSINSIILRFPQFRQGLEEIRGVFRQFDGDSNGTIDHEELKKCLQKLQFNLTEQELNELFESCEFWGSKGMKFDEFIVVLCLIYLLGGTSNHKATTMGSPELKATFDAIIESFLYLDKNGDGKLDKKDMIKVMNDDFPKEKAPMHITMNRFSNALTLTHYRSEVVKRLELL